MNRNAPITGLLVILAGAGTAHSFTGWVEFTNETALRLLNPDGTPFSLDAAEKDFAWGDVDNDGDTDLVVARKRESGLICNGSSLCHNILFMHEGIAEGWPTDHVLVDRTLEYATEADDGGQGFFDLTNDRDIALLDVDGDTWLDVVTAPAAGHGLPKTISHPRVYINKGEVGGEWQGLRYEEARIPQFFTIPGGIAAAPRFAAVATGDVTGDGYPDLYFGDYDGAVSAPEMPPGHDLNDRLLVNLGHGYFEDSLESRMTTQMLRSAFNMATAIADMNGDGVKDVVKDTALQTPQEVSISYNNPSNIGFFQMFDVVVPSGDTPYHITVGHLNDDNRLDLVVSSDGTDNYRLNLGNNANGEATFSPTTFFNGGGGFSGNSVIADLNNDGHNDVLIADHHPDFFGCNNRLRIYRNFGDNPNVTIQEQGGAAPWTPNGTHDVAVFDLNDDNWPDMVIGTCQGYQIWINEPPFGVVFGYPGGLPGYVQADEEHVFQVALGIVGGGTLVENSGVLHYAVDGGTFQSVSMTFLGDDTYEAALPAAECPQTIAWYVSADLQEGGTFTDPPDGGVSPYLATAAGGTGVTLNDDLEGDVSGWSVNNGVGLTTGAWELADPNGTIQSGNLASPEDDATATEGAVFCFVTENGTPGGSVGAADVDGGSTELISPTLDLANSDSRISYSRWLYSTGGNIDPIIVEISNDGGQNWVLVDTVGPTGSTWQSATFRVNDFVAPTATVNVRFTVGDPTNDSVTEAAIDNFIVEQTQCPPAGDCNNDLAADLADHTEFHGCLAGPNGSLGTGCGCFDFDDSLAIDLHDFRELQIAIGN